MARTRPTSEPSILRAGETWEWERTLSAYPAAEWTLSYTFTNATAKLSITAGKDGDTHVVSVAQATTAAYTAGRYDGFGQVTDGSETFSVWAGGLEVLPDLATATSYDGRSHARVMLDAILALLEGRASDDQLDQVSAVLGDRSQARNPELLLPMRDRYRVEVLREEQAKRSGATGRILVRQ